LARELLWNGRVKSAVQEFKRHIDMKRWPAERAQSMIHVGDAYGMLNNGDEQHEWYHRSFVTDSSRREALLSLARFFKHHNEPIKVVAYTKAAMEIPWSGFYGDSRSRYENEPHELLYWAYGWLGRIPEAKEHIIKALQFQPFNPNYLRDTQYYFDYPDNGVEGWMVFEDLQWLYETAKVMPKIGEVGSWKGRSTHALCSGSKGFVYAIDHFKGSAEVGDATHGANDDLVYSQFLSNTNKFKNLRVNRKESSLAVNDYPNKFFDMVFIDAEHSYEGVKQDIKLWKPKAKFLLCGHDWHPAWANVKRAVVESLGDVEVSGSIWYKWVCEFPKVSIVIPTLGREDKLLRLLSKIKENANYPDYEVIVEPDSFDNRQGVPTLVKRGVEKAKGDLIMYLGNDCIPEKNFLLYAVLKMMRDFPDMDGLVGLNDGYWTSEFATHWLASKKLLPLLDGEFFHTGYHHLGCDNELTERTRQMGKFVWCEEARVYHDHPIQDGFKQPVDEVYQIAYDATAKEEDEKLLKARSEKYGFLIRGPFSKPRAYPTVPEVLDLRLRLNDVENMKVVNCGVGDCQSSLGSQLPFFRFKSIINIDLHKPYLDHAKSLIWDAQQVDFIEWDVTTYPFSDWTVFLFDIVEHLEKEAAIKLLNSVKRAMVFVPLETEVRENTSGVPYQEHISKWTEEDFIQLGYKTERLPNFHGYCDGLWAIKGV
jgi:tetratricopeptide (TPR) repeat protein